MVMKGSFKVLFFIGMCVGVYANNAFADDDVATLVVDNGTPIISVPEPSILPLILAGVIAVIAVRIFKSKK